MEQGLADEQYMEGCGPQHAAEIRQLRSRATSGEPSLLMSLAMLAAADLLEAHDETGISLDDWDAPRRLVEYLLQRPISPNGV